MEKKSLNALGMYDNAVLFELFAIEISKLWFKEEFHNLNDANAQFPVFDLISEDESIFVQVSTEQNINKKIKDTLKKLESTSDERLKSVTEAYFFMLSNESEKNCKSLIGKDRIGKIDFDPDKHLITTKDVLNKAKTDLMFQEGIGYTIDNTTKTRALFEINKGVGRNDGVEVNTRLPENLRRVYFCNMIYVADGPSDIPAFSLVNRNNGLTFAIYPSGGYGSNASC